MTAIDEQRLEEFMGRVVADVAAAESAAVPTWATGSGCTGAVWAATDPVGEAFRTGRGVGRGDHDDRLCRGVERSLAPLCRGQLVQEWIRALDGVDTALRFGGRVADVGCGLFYASSVFLCTPKLAGQEGTLGLGERRWCPATRLPVAGVGRQRAHRRPAAGARLRL